MMTMADLLTFFQPGDDAGTAWTFSSPSTQEPQDAWVYVPREVDLSQFANWEVSSQEHFNQLLEETREEIEKHGGILVEARAHNDVIRLALFSGNGAPRKMLRLRPVGDPQFESFSASADLEAGDHLILPVSAAAQQKLETFDKVCDGFPKDLRSTLFNVIRRPSLEWRIQRIEEMLSLEPPTQAEQQKSRQHSPAFRVKLPRWLLWPIPAGLVAAAVVLLASAFVGYKLWPGDATVTEETSTTTPEPTVKTVPVDPPVAPPVEPAGDPVTPLNVTDPDEQPAPVLTDAEVDLNKSVDDLYGALKTTQVPALQQLYTTHFKNHQPDFFGKSSPGPWGVAKLQALKWNLLPRDDKALEDVLRKARVKEAYRAEPARKILASEASAVKLLSWGFCESTGSAAIPATNSEPKAALPLPVGKSCQELQPQDAIAGLRDLTLWVEQQTP